MNIIEKNNELIVKYVHYLAEQINSQYPDLMDESKISKAIDMFKDSSLDFEEELKPKINELAKKVITDYIELQKNY